jgi:hypothetical protein
MPTTTIGAAAAPTPNRVVTEEKRREEKPNEETPASGAFPSMSTSDVMAKLPNLGAALERFDQSDRGNKNLQVDEFELAQFNEASIKAYYNLAQQPALLANFKAQVSEMVSHHGVHKVSGVDFPQFYAVEFQQVKNAWDKLDLDSREAATDFVMNTLKSSNPEKVSDLQVRDSIATYLTTNKYGKLTLL